MVLAPPPSAGGASGLASTPARWWRNRAVACAANFVGAAGLALLVAWSGRGGLNGGAVGQAVVRLATAKAALDPGTAFVRGVLCNALVCMAVWMAPGGRSVTDQVLAIVFPITAFVAAGAAAGGGTVDQADVTCGRTSPRSSPCPAGWR